MSLICLNLFVGVTFAFDCLSQTVFESDQYLTITILKFGYSNIPLSIELNTSDPTDYGAMSIIFAPSDRERTFNFAIESDNTLEDTEVLFVYMRVSDGNMGRATVQQEILTVNILDSTSKL